MRLLTRDPPVAKRQLSILQVSTRDIRGGAESSAWNLFEAYRRAGLESWLAVGTKLTNDPGVFEISHEGGRPAWVAALRRAQRRMQVRGQSLRATLMGALAWLGEPRRLVEVRLLGREDFSFPASASILGLPPHRPDVVHCHNLHGNYFDLRVLPTLSTEIPVILNLRDEWLLTGHCAYSIGCERWRNGCGRCPDLTIYPAIPRDTTAYNWRRKRRIFGASHLYLTAPSRWLLERATGSLPPVALSKVIPNAIDLATFRPGDQAAARAVLGLPQKAWVVVCSAHTPFKDLDTVKEALTLLPSTRPVIGFCMGREGPPERLGTAELRFAGFIPSPTDVATTLQAGDVFVHAALSEAFGKTAAEAMACGLPVVATEVGGLPEVVRNKREGLLIPPRDPAALAASLIALMTHPDLGRTFANAAHQRALDEFSIDTQVSRFLTWYPEVIAEWTSWRSGHG
jgi:glycosyltransferase involved in cell wall biosynthesis